MKVRNAITHRKRRRRSRVGAKCGELRRASNSAAIHVPKIAQDILSSGAVIFLARTGLSIQTIAGRLRGLAATIESGGIIPTVHSEDYELFVTVSGVLHDWVRGSDYTGLDGGPKALTLRGRRGLAALIRKRIPSRPMSEILRWMRARKIAGRRRDGRYVLLKRAALAGYPDPLQLELAANFAALYLRSAVRNWEEKEPSARHFDRIARVFNLPVKEVPKFRDFVKRRAEGWLFEIDNWLEDHDEPTSRRRRVQAGVHVYGYASGVETPRVQRAREIPAMY